MEDFCDSGIPLGNWITGQGPCGQNGQYLLDVSWRRRDHRSMTAELLHLSVARLPSDKHSCSHCNEVSPVCLQTGTDFRTGWTYSLAQCNGASPVCPQAGIAFRTGWSYALVVNLPPSRVRPVTTSLAAEELQSRAVE